VLVRELIGSAEVTADVSRDRDGRGCAWGPRRSGPSTRAAVRRLDRDLIGSADGAPLVEVAYSGQDLPALSRLPFVAGVEPSAGRVGLDPSRGLS
jgi:hypothetical protein